MCEFCPGALALNVLKKIFRIGTCIVLAALAIPANARVIDVPARLDESDGANWTAILDLRDLPAQTAPKSITVSLDLSKVVMNTEVARVSIGMNGFILTDLRRKADGIITITGKIERRFISTRNRIDVSVQPDCAQRRCSLAGARLTGPLRIGTTKAPSRPTSFADFVTRFREGVSIEATGQRDRDLARFAHRAIAPRAPVIDPETDTAMAQIVVSDTPPTGFNSKLRFDRGPVALRSAEGRTVFAEGEIERLTFAQILEVEGRPTLWIRPGATAVTREMELDYGNIAAFDETGRVLAFSPAFDTALRIAYAGDARSEPLFPVWRIAIVLAWLAASIALYFVMGRVPSMRAIAS